MKFLFRIFAGLILSLFIAANLLAANPPAIAPVGADGKPLNLDFETGTLKDWTADGEAFKGQPAMLRRLGQLVDESKQVARG